MQHHFPLPTSPPPLPCPDSVKQAADAAGRRICFVGMSLNHYLEAAHKDGKAPIDPRDILQPNELDDIDPNQVLYPHMMLQFPDALGRGISARAPATLL